MDFLLDTNICIYLIRQKPPQVLQKFLTLAPGMVGVSTITVAELEYGVAKSSRPETNQQALSQFLVPLDIISFDYEATLIYGRIRAELVRKGTPIGPLDLLIAAHALSINATLVTNNEKEFSRIPELKLENWAQ